MDTSVPIVPIVIAEPSIYFCEKHEPVVLSPLPPIAPLRSDEQQKTVEELKQIVADLTALVQQLASSRPA
jgi:hypothetical protein